MTALYEVKDLALDFTGSRGGLAGLMPWSKFAINILSGISFNLEKGETLGLVGESGSGKTTLARAMLGLIKPSAGNLCFEGKPLTTPASFVKLRRASAMMFQDPVASLSPRMTVASLITEPLVIHGRPMASRRESAEALLDRVGLDRALASRYPHELSGGQARRVCVARALALDPKLVIADEPTAGLDVSVQGEILNLMTGLKRTLGLSFLVITHNLAMVRHVSDRIAILYLGRLMELGPTHSVFAAPRHPYTMSLIASEPQPDPRKRRSDLAIRGEIPSVLARPRGCAFHTRCAFAQGRCTEEEPELRQLDDGHLVSCHFAGHLKPTHSMGEHHEHELAH